MKNKLHLLLKKVKPEFPFDDSQLIPVLNKKINLNEQTSINYEPKKEKSHRVDSTVKYTQKKALKQKKVLAKKSKPAVNLTDKINKKDTLHTDTLKDQSNKVTQLENVAKPEKLIQKKSPKLHKEKKKILEDMKKREDHIAKHQQTNKGIEI